jgi:hypothetical protein
MYVYVIIVCESKVTSESASDVEIHFDQSFDNCAISKLKSSLEYMFYYCLCLYRYQKSHLASDHSRSLDPFEIVNPCSANMPRPRQLALSNPSKED